MAAPNDSHSKTANCKLPNKNYNAFTNTNTNQCGSNLVSHFESIHKSKCDETQSCMYEIQQSLQRLDNLKQN